MASSSSSASNSKYCPQWKYVVFLSFRGEDTRKIFTGHLYEGLKNRGISTFQDDKRLEHRDSIPKELLRAIEESQVALIVFSKNYATSKCESFGAAFANHELKYKDDVEGMQKVQRWRNALTVAANLKGYDIRDGIESENIQQIVDCISSKFRTNAYSLSVLQDVVGINDHLRETKIQTSNGNQRCSDFRDLGNRRNRKKDDYVNDKYDGKCMIPSILCSMKVLIVLDDIDHSEHLEYLAGDVDWFGNGSRVIVTTRNKHLIEKDDAIYEVSTLPDHEAMLLFNKHAFKKEDPDESFKKFSLEVVNHAKGLPLALKVWGCLLHKKCLTLWRITVEQIKKNSNSEIVKKLKLPKKRSRIWDVEDVKKVMIDYTGTMTVEAIQFSCFGEELCFNNEAMKKMKSLRILHIVAAHTKFFASRPSSNHHDDSIEYLSNNLRWLVWNRYSWKSLPENFKPEKLVYLELRWSSLHYLWKETKDIRSVGLTKRKSNINRINMEGNLFRAEDHEDRLARNKSRLTNLKDLLIQMEGISMEQIKANES
uniref:Disease resistance protein, putative n=1 Tax=Solanum demissum TaxID=50514 RepID=Q0KIK2_SOLDE|nr:Disease resistance protein, putative [Solanum demissum]